MLSVFFFFSAKGDHKRDESDILFFFFLNGRVGEKREVESGMGGGCWIKNTIKYNEVEKTYPDITIHEK